MMFDIMLLKTLGGRAAAIGDQNVQPPEAQGGLLNQPMHVCVPGQIGFNDHRRRLAVHFAEDGLLRFHQSLRVAAAHDHTRALAGQPPATSATLSFSPRSMLIDPSGRFSRLRSAAEQIGCMRGLGGRLIRILNWDNNRVHL